MAKLRPQHCFWLAAVCFVAGLTTFWSDDVVVVTSEDRVPLLEPQAGTVAPPELTRSREELSSTSIAEPLQIPPQTLVDSEQPLRAAVLTVSPLMRERVGTNREALVPAAFAASSDSNVPEAVWLSGRIEMLESR
ncbi:hypothetical protein [Planctomicrobium sp. SH664]|uniref:hypothetical protein n=1 Tax=Planctomicrobium sp. SH664 TaxID=3448125 RepID=UPI003F5ADE0F